MCHNESDNIKPFKILSLNDFFRKDAEKILMASRLADTIRGGMSDIKAGGNEVEIAVRNFFKEKLYPKYHVSDGHILDKNMHISPQLDLLIADNTKSPVFNVLADSSEILYYEPVYAYGEVKKSYYKRELLDEFSYNLKRIKEQMDRECILPDVVECTNTLLKVRTNLTSYPLRNILFTFMFFSSSKGVNTQVLKDRLALLENSFLPNIMIFLDWGIVLNVDKKVYEEEHRLKINLYPEYISKEEGKWIVLNWDESSHILAYSYMLLLEHLNNSIVSIPDFNNYTSKIFDFSLTNISDL